MTSFNTRSDDGQRHAEGPGFLYTIRIKGNSMAPRYRSGEYVVVDPGVRPKPGADVVVCLKDGRSLIKTLDWRQVGKVQLLSVNGDYPPITLMLDAIERIECITGRFIPEWRTRPPEWRCRPAEGGAA